MDQYPDFTFAQTSGRCTKMMEKYYPEVYKRNHPPRKDTQLDSGEFGLDSDGREHAGRGIIGPSFLYGQKDHEGEVWRYGG